MSKELKKSLLWAGGVLAVALLASLARSQGLIDQDAGHRIILGVIGLMVVAYGNRIPKAFTRTREGRNSKRVAGWAMVLSGLVYAAAFVFAPIDIAVVVGCGAVIAGLMTTMGYCWMQRRNLAV